MSRHRTSMFRVIATAIVLISLTGLTIGQGSSDSLEQGFRQPPDAAKPWSGGTG